MFILEDIFQQLVDDDAATFCPDGTYTYPFPVQRALMWLFTH